jgi:hypothetical protein
VLAGGLEPAGILFNSLVATSNPHKPQAPHTPSIKGGGACNGYFATDWVAVYWKTNNGRTLMRRPDALRFGNR